LAKIAVSEANIADKSAQSCQEAKTPDCMMLGPSRKVEMAVLHAT
jgi:hypothetical protein